MEKTYTVGKFESLWLPELGVEKLGRVGLLGFLVGCGKLGELVKVERTEKERWCGYMLMCCGRSLASQPEVLE